MSQSVYIEDIYLEFYHRSLSSASLDIDPKDSDACENFYQLCSANKPLTEKQANYLIRILKKYKSKICDSTFDYTEDLKEPKFKNAFRIIEDTKRIYIDQEESGKFVVCVQFPYKFKEIFDTEMEIKYHYPSYVWDEKRYARKADFFKVNFLQLNSFVLEHGFVIDETFQKVVADLEQAIENQENIVPYSTVKNGQVELQLCSDDVREIFLSLDHADLNQQMLSAKTMGFPLRLEKKPENLLEKISSSSSTLFWMKDITELFDLYKRLRSKIVIIIDRAQDTMTWLNDFVEKSEICGIDRQKIRICFRESKNQDTGLNQWVRDNKLGGKVDSADILIFQHTPSKWLFKEENFAKILVTTMINPPTSMITTDWFDSHPCVIYLSDIRPTIKGKRKIVDL
jgi:hypothetical protein